MKKSQEVSVLKDVDKKGKIRDWRGKKMTTLKLSKSYGRISDKIKPEYESRGVHRRYALIKRQVKDKIGEIISIAEKKSIGLYDKDGNRVVNYAGGAKNMRFCGNFLEFEKIEERLKLLNAKFCHVSLCPMCQWRKSMRTYFEVSKIMRLVEMRHVTYVPIFLTLTVRNCSIDKLAENMDSIFNAWFELMRSKALNPEVKGERKHIIKGWFRALEVEYDGDIVINKRRYNNAKRYYEERGIKAGSNNPNFDTFHPHFHAIMLVDRSYFKNKDYKATSEWVQLWRKAAKLDYDPVCHVQRTRSSKDKRNEVAEVAKYTYKDAAILNKRLSDDKKDDVVKNLSSALHGRRLYAYGGVMKGIAAELKQMAKQDRIEADEGINESLARMILKYNWSMGVSNYVLVENEQFSAKERVGEENA